MDINNVLKEAKEKLLNSNIDEREARLLLSYVLGIKKEELLLYKDVSNEKVEEFFEVIDRRCKGEPFSYITGNKEFMKLVFEVNKSVLIPREDTEILVQEVVNLCTNGKYKSKNVSILDMCTGSGCIAISLAKYINESKVTGVDLSENALEVARKNAQTNNVNINFIKSDLFENVQETFDIIVSNPPYIKTDVIKDLQKEVKDFEPRMALDGGETGLDFYTKIIEESRQYLIKGGKIFLEIGYDQAEDVRNLLITNGYEDIKVVKDYSGNDRVLIADFS